MQLHESSEDYLEAIYVLGERQDKVRAVDVCKEMGFAKSTVSVALKKLKENDYIRIWEDGKIELTESGREVAEKIYERHVILAKLFMLLGVEEETAYRDSCLMEHDISESTFAALKKLYLEEKKRRLKETGEE